MIMDLHNHTTYSYDGSNSPEELIENAIRNGVDVIGITDHQFTIRQNIHTYIEHILRCKEKYVGRIKVFAGLEVGMRPRPDDLFSDDVSELDYILFESLDRYNAEDFYEFLPWRHKFKCPVGLAHCDIFKMSEEYGRDMLKVLKDENIFWELNTSGNYNYYYDFLTNEKKRNAIKSAGISVSVGSDTHAVIEFRKNQLIRANELVSDMGLSIPFMMY